MRRQLIRQAIAIIAPVTMLTILVACEQPSPGVTSEELRAAVQDAIEETQRDPAPPGPSVEEIEVIVHSAVEEAAAQLQSTQMPAGPSAEDIEEIVYDAIDERVADLPSADDIRAMLETAVQVSAAPPAVYGQCSAQLNSCDAGIPGNVADTQDEYKWKCTGADGGSTAFCSQPKSETTVGGQCGVQLNSCDAGIPGHVADTPEEYKWKCTGAGGGSTAFCSFPKPDELVGCSVNASCGSELDSCTEGFFADIDDTAETYMWRCLGDLSVTCSKSK